MFFLFTDGWFVELIQQKILRWTISNGDHFLYIITQMHFTHTQRDAFNIEIHKTDRVFF